MPNEQLESNKAEQELLDKLVIALKEIPGFAVQRHELENRDPDHDARVELDVAGQRIVLLIECKREILPAQARQILWQFRRYLGDDARPVTPFVLADCISAGARDVLKTEGVGFHDGTGTLYLPAPGAFVFIDKGLPASRAAGERKLFAPRRAQAVHALLRERARWFGVLELAKAADIAPATASEVLSLLDQLEWVEVRGQGPAKERHLTEPARLLDAWAAAFTAMKRPPLRRYFVPRLGTDNQDLFIARAFDDVQAAYAISHEAGAQRLAPLLTHVGKTRMRVVAGDGIAEALNHLQAKPVESGWNLGLWEGTVSDLQFRERVDAAWVASPIHVYLDLLQESEGRSKELAAHLRKERIGF